MESRKTADRGRTNISAALDIIGPFGRNVSDTGEIDETAESTGAGGRPEINFRKG